MYLLTSPSCHAPSFILISTKGDHRQKNVPCGTSSQEMQQVRVRLQPVEFECIVEEPGFLRPETVSILGDLYSTIGLVL